MILLLFVVISFAAGSFNYFPSDPFDGGRMAKIMLAPYFSFLGFNRKETYKFIGRLFMWLLIISLTLNLIPYLTMFT
jgi:membrane-associated protease RseP (regulator of RpoE activity)